LLPQARKDTYAAQARFLLVPDLSDCKQDDTKDESEKCPEFVMHLREYWSTLENCATLLRNRAHLNESSMGKPPFRDIGRLLLAWEEGDEHALDPIAPLRRPGGATSRMYGK
jgi:hypothetical protein